MKHFDRERPDGGCNIHRFLHMVSSPTGGRAGVPQTSKIQEEEDLCSS